MERLKSYLNYLLLVPIVLLLSTVFIINDELANGVISGKYFWFYFSIGITSLTIFLSFIVTIVPIKFTFPDLLFSLFALTGITSSYFNTYAISTRFILFILLFILYFYFRIILVQNKNNLHILLHILIITGFIEAVWGLRQLYGYSHSQHSLFKLTGSFFNPGPYGGYLALIAPLTIYYLLKEYNVLNKKFHKSLIPSYISLSLSASTLFSILLVLPATMSRASWLAALGGSSVIGIQYLLNNYQIKNIWRNNKRKIIYTLTTLLILLLIGGICLYQFKKDSADGRAFIWKISLHTIPDHITGSGLGNFAGAYGNGQAAYFESGKGTDQDEYVAGSTEYAFNEYLQICIELGVLPFLLFVSGICSAFILCVRNKRIEVAGALTALLIFAFMSYPFNVLPFLIVFVFLLASSPVNSQAVKTEPGKTEYITSWCVITLSFVVVLFCLKNRYPTYDSYKTWKNTRMLYNMSLYKEAVREYHELEPYLNDQTSFMFEYARSLSQIEEYEKSNTIIDAATKISFDPMFYNIKGKNYQAMRKYELAEYNFKKAANMIPNRLYPYYLLANMYLESGDTIRAIEMAKTVLTKEPKTNSRAVEEMRVEMRKIIDKEIEP